jgi:epoxyqueuosine reductase
VEEMEETIRSAVVRFVRESPENRFPNDGAAYFDEPLVGFAAADDPLFGEYKRIIGDFHLLPGEFLEGAESVVVWVLPITRATRESNRSETELPSREWALTRFHGEKLNGALRRHLVSWLEGRGERAVAPQLSEKWKEYAETPVGIASAWSERHAAYAAGLGTFSLSDALITPKGIAHRLGSIVTTLRLEPSPRPYPDHRHNCLRFRDGSCGLCVARCPVGALTWDGGHDKYRCRELVYGTAPAALAETYGVPQTGCGLCQTKVPCEAGIPAGAKRAE